MRRLPLRRQAVVLLGGLVLLLMVGGGPAASALPTGFQETVVFSGLTNPTAFEFAPDGRVFVAEKGGRIKVFDSLSDSTPDLFADLSANVHDFWDRGMLGFALDPGFTTGRPYVYVLYTFDAPIGGSPPTWGDNCPNPPGATGDGCVVSARLSRLTASGNSMTGSENVLINNWCQQYPSHSIGSLAFGADGALYVSGGDGASFNFADWGQDGNPLNPCGDPPGGVGATLAPPSAEGGALRSQDLRTTSDPTTLDGAILRVNPDTGQAMPNNPNAGSSDANARRIIAHGLRNPFRFTIRPGTNEVWLGDVGWNTWEEINRIADPLGSVENFGWPCYEGNGTQPSYDSANLTLCENLYALPGGVVAPYYTYNHGAQVVSGESCPTGSSSIAGLAFYPGGPFPNSYDGALFFADYSRDCIWVMFPGTNGLPRVASRATFQAPAANPVALEVGPDGALYYADFLGGTIRRIAYAANQPPVANATASPTSGTAPLTVSFDGSGSNDPEGDPLTYSWDLNGDGTFGDSTAVRPTFTYTQPGTYNARLRVTDNANQSTTSAPVAISAGNSPPTAAISGPAPGTTWKVGDVITFSGSATDPQQGTLPASNLSWELVLFHCPSNCHTHPLQTWSGVAGGSFSAPDHEYPSYLELRLTATDAGGLTDTKTLRLDPRTVDLTFQSAPTALQIAAGASLGTTPFTRQVIEGSNNTISAPSPQTLSGASYAWSSWSDGGAQSHNITASEPATYIATYVNRPPIASATAFPTNGPAPLTVQFDGSGSTDPEGGPLTYAWDLDGDGTFTDSTAVKPTFTYTQPGLYNARLRVRDNANQTTTSGQLTIGVGNTPPTAAIESPLSSTTWKVGDLIAFSGSASDPQQGVLPASSLSWALALVDCSSTCETHTIQTWPGVTSGAFVAPDAPSSSHLELRLTATDAGGLTDAVTLRLDPRTVLLTFQSSPAGLQLTVGGASTAAPFTREVIAGSSKTLSAPSPQTLNGTPYIWVSWSDGGAESHTITAPAAPGAFVAAFAAPSVAPPPPPPATAKQIRCIVPRLIGRKLAATPRLLRRSHCRLGRVRWMFSRTPSGVVRSQRPRRGTRLPNGARVAVVVSRGPTTTAGR